MIYANWIFRTIGYSIYNFKTDRCNRLELVVGNLSIMGRICSHRSLIFIRILYCKAGASFNEKMQNTEIEHAQYISSLLGLEMFEIQSDSYSTLKEVINN